MTQPDVGSAPKTPSATRLILLMLLAGVIGIALVLGVFPLTDCPGCGGSGKRSDGAPCSGKTDTCGGDGRTSILHRLGMKSHWAKQGDRE